MDVVSLVLTAAAASAAACLDYCGHLQLCAGREPLDVSLEGFCVQQVPH